MNEQEVRSLVREAIERHLGRPDETSRVSLSTHVDDRAVRPLFSAHASHIILNVAPGSEIDEGACVIEPSVRCNHCGFCQSLGH